MKKLLYVILALVLIIAGLVTFHTCSDNKSSSNNDIPENNEEIINEEASSDGSTEENDTDIIVDEEITDTITDEETAEDSSTEESDEENDDDNIGDGESINEENDGTVTENEPDENVYQESVTEETSDVGIVTPPVEDTAEDNGDTSGGNGNVGGLGGIGVGGTESDGVGDTVEDSEEEPVEEEGDDYLPDNTESQIIEPTKGTLTCGVTFYENVNEQDENGNWIGFESEFATAVGELLGINVDFKVIDWDCKLDELNSGSIDCIWNFFTANTKENGVPRSELVDFTYGYMFNQQCVVTNSAKAEDIKSLEDLENMKVGVLDGSVGEYLATDKIRSRKISEYESQEKALSDVKAGIVDYAIVNTGLALRLCGKDDFAELMIDEDIVFYYEIYAVAFRKGSELTPKVNEAIKALFDNGKIYELGKKYGFENLVCFVDMDKIDNLMING